MERGERLRQIIAQWSEQKVPTEVSALAEAARQRHGGIAGVLFYGSWLRGGRLGEGMADLYLLVDDYTHAFRSRWQALANWLLPPNVFHLKLRQGGKLLYAKYAVISRADFLRATSWFHPYIWARFAQPSVLIFARRPEDTAEIRAALAMAVCTFVRQSLPVAPATFTTRELWTMGLKLSYRCELRPEDPAAVERIFMAAADYYEAVTPAALEAAGIPFVALPASIPVCYRVFLPSRVRCAGRLAWPLRQLQGKLLSILRLTKALTTFENGVDYVLWKIERHSGVHVECSPRLQRFPLLAAGVTLWRMLKKGAFR